MTTTPIVSRGWCDLSTCAQRSVARDCVRFGFVTVCTPCLIDFSGGVEPEELREAEKELGLANDRIDVLEGQLEKARQAPWPATK